jgi:N-acetyl-gamma-glutamyl-phosphate reductase
VVGSNHVTVQVTLDERVGRVLAVAAIDNLAKGTAGAAVQCLNLAVGLPEPTGLLGSGVAP